MGKIMEIQSPHLYYHTTYKDHKHSFMKGDKVLDMFYSQGIWKENYIPKELEDMVFIGSKVLVPFGRLKNLEEAHVVGIKQSSEFEIKDIAK